MCRVGFGLLSNSTSPGRIERWSSGNRGIAGAISKKIGEVAADSKQVKIINKINAFYDMTYKEALRSHKGNYSIDYSCIDHITYSNYGNGEVLLYIYLNDQSGLWPIKNKRKFLIEYIDKSMADNTIENFSTVTNVKFIKK